MKDKVLLIDFGSTFTKAVYVDLNRNEIIGKSNHFSTVDTDVTEGLRKCLKDISRDSGIKNLEQNQALACSSAAGGLRVACIGFVSDYSSEAANRAALGAGAKVIGCFSYEMTSKEIEEIESLSPDIILLSGGTDGGDKKVIIHNAKMLATRAWSDTSIIIAGNKSARDEMASVFKGRENIFFAKNVMPEVGRLEVDSCNQIIRELFLTRIIEAKGIAKAKSLITNILMPTPSAVLEAAQLIADGYRSLQNRSVSDSSINGTSAQGDLVPGLGELMVIDVGGATTDIHSVAEGKPGSGGVTQVGLPEPYVKRTVEGDLGLRYNIDRLVEIAKQRGASTNIEQTALKFCKQGYLPDGKDEVDCHMTLTRLAVETAVNRHAGKIEIKYGPSGEVVFQHGKDLTNIRCVIGTGGPIIHSKNPKEVLERARFNEKEPNILKPKSPQLFLDAEYIMYAGGLLSNIKPEKAFLFLKKYVKEL
ncbi:MAG: glutamate mutase L [Deltaproteobacteria bacterium]|nr:glutamate mutase L [Deltaproteobacteria bacterium]